MKYLVIEKDKLLYNLNLIKNMANGKTVIAVLKGNGYGLGIVEYAKLLNDNGINFFAVSDVKEAVKLRKNEINGEILLLTQSLDEEILKVVVENDITATVGSVLSAEKLNSVASQKRVKAHIKIDTGFGRFGFLPDDLKNIKAYNNIDYTGVYSHLSDSFGKNKNHSYKQFELFNAGINILRENGINPPLKHICNSCGFLRFKEMHLDAVRIGSLLLGRVLSGEAKEFKRVGYLKSEIIEVRNLPKGHNIGYANTCILKKDTTVAVIPVGYKDGFGVVKANDTFRFFDKLRYLYADLKLFLKPQGLFITINEKKYRLMGRVGMYNVVADVTGINPLIGTEVRLDINPLFVDGSIERIIV